MTRSYMNPEADYTPSDMGPPDRNNGATWDDFHDGELERLRLTDESVPL